MLYIYVLPKKECPNLTAFLISEWNDKDICPLSAREFMKKASLKGLRFTIDNFQLCFNLKDKETNNKNYFIYCPREDFEKLSLTSNN